MKLIYKVLAVAILFQLASCGSEDGLSKREKEIVMLTSTAWGNAIVTNEPDGDVTSQYDDFAIVFTKKKDGDFDGTYSISNGGYAFSETVGKWKFNNELTAIVLDSGKEMNFELDDDSLTLNFYVVSAGGRRGLSGEFTFELSGL